MSFEKVPKQRYDKIPQTWDKWDKNVRMWFVSMSEETVVQPIIQELR